MFDNQQGLTAIRGQSSLSVTKAENGFVLLENWNNTSRVYLDFDSMVADLKRYFEPTNPQA